MSDEETFEKTESQSSLVYPKQVGSLKKGDIAMLKGFPCKVMEITCAKTGKHGHAKATITGIDIFTGKKHEDSAPTSHSIEVPFVDRKEYSLQFIDGDGFASLLEPDTGKLKSDIKFTPDNEDGSSSMAKKANEYLDAGKDVTVQVLTACGTDAIIDVRESTAGTGKK